MFGHILKCKVVQPDKVHPELFKGANRRFKRTPWNQIEKRRLEAGKTRGQWSKKIGEEEKKRQVKMQKMKAMGYEMEVPKLKGVDEVPVREKQPEIDAAGEEKAKEAGAAPVEVAAEPVAAEDKPPKEVSKKNKKEKKEKKSASKEVPAPSVLTKEADEVNEDTVAEPEKKKKSKAKSKTEPAAATATTPEKPASKEKAAAASVESLAAVKGEDPKKKAKSKTETATTPEKKTKTKKAGKDGKKSTKA
jgi:nucleolar protein 15